MGSWTLRLQSLARPFSDLRVYDCATLVAEFFESNIDAVEYSPSGAKRTNLIRDFKKFCYSPPDWSERLTVIASLSNGLMVQFYLLRTPSHGKDPAAAAGYQCNEIIVDFLGRQSSMLSERELVLPDFLVKLCRWSNAEFGVVHPIGPDLRQLHRERGLAEGVPGIFCVTVLGQRFRKLFPSDAIQSISVPAKRDTTDGILVIQVAQHIGGQQSCTKEELRAVRELLGADAFAAERVVAPESSGVFSLLELIRMSVRQRATSREAILRTARRRADLDWSGVINEGCGKD